jgi:hypothetical protein
MASRMNLTTHSYAIRQLAGVDIRRASASKDAELKTILARVEATVGLATLNRSISRLLQQILVD